MAASFRVRGAHLTRIEKVAKSLASFKFSIPLLPNAAFDSCAAGLCIFFCSSEEFVGQLRFGQFAKRMIQRKFQNAENPKRLRIFSLKKIAPTLQSPQAVLLGVIEDLNDKGKVTIGSMRDRML